MFKPRFLSALVFTIVMAASAVAMAQGDPLAPLTEGDLTAYREWSVALRDLTDENGDLPDPQLRVDFFNERGISIERFSVINERISNVIYGVPMMITQTLPEADAALINKNKEALERAILGGEM